MCQFGYISLEDVNQSVNKRQLFSIMIFWLVVINRSKCIFADTGVDWRQREKHTRFAVHLAHRSVGGRK